MKRKSFLKTTLLGAGGLFVSSLSTKNHEQGELKYMNLFMASENEDWKVVHMDDLCIKKGSALDISGLAIREPAGSFGRVILDKTGHCVFEMRPDMRLRFFGATGDGEWDLLRDKPDKATIEKMADTMMRQGYNMFRLIGHPVLGKDLQINEDYVDRWDYLIKCLKERGIYLYWALSWGNTQEMYADEASRAVWEKGTTLMLNHVNPYTKTRLLDDPMLAVLLFHNEHEIRPRGTPTALTAAWRKFLQKKYGSMEQLRIAWKGLASMPTEDSFEQVNYFSQPESWYRDPRLSTAYGVDIAQFCREMEEGMLLWFIKTVRKIGYQGLVSHYDFWKTIYLIGVRNHLQVVTMHNYHDHPWAPYRTAGARLGGNSSAFDDDLNWIGTFAGTRFSDRPFMITEYGQCFWNQYRYEEGLTFGAYASFQGWDLIMAHQGQVALTGRVIAPWRVSSDPIARASQWIHGIMMLRGDVSPALKSISGQVQFDDLVSSEGVFSVGGNQTRLSLVTGFGVSYPAPKPVDVSTRKPDLTVNLIGGAEMGWSANNPGQASVIEKTDDEQNSLIEEIRKKGLLPASNRTDVQKRIYESDTGQLWMDAPAKKMLVKTPRLEGVCAASLAEETVLGATIIHSCSVPASISVVALDDTPDLASSGRILVVFATDARNSKMELAEGGKLLKNPGELPALLRTGTLSMSIRNKHSGHVKAWALAMNGERMEPVGIKTDGDRIILDIDTRILSKGATPFFEIVKEN